MPSPEEPIGRLGAITARQHGVFAVHQAAGVGLPRWWIDRRRIRGELVTVDEGVLRSVLTPAGWKTRLMAACLAGPAVGSHRAAGALWSLPLDAEPPVEVTAIRHRRRKQADVVWHESYFLDPTDITEIDRIPATTAARTVIDLAGVLTDDALGRVLDDALRRHLTSVGQLGRLLDRLGTRRPGVHRLVDALATPRAAVPESDLETRFSLLLRSAGLPAPVAQHVVRAPDGRSLRIDFAYVEERVGMELLGARFHASVERWPLDMERLATLSALSWHMLVFTDRDVEQRAQTVVAAIEHARSRGHPA